MYLGSATIFQGGRKVDEVTAALFTAGHGFLFGYYLDADDRVHSGPARIRFHDGSEADADLAAVHPDHGGFLLTSQLVELRHNE
jgi:hypothetical protein